MHNLPCRVSETPFIWQYQKKNSWHNFAEEECLKLEEYYSDPNNNQCSAKAVKVGTVEVNFEEFVYTSNMFASGSIRRFSFDYIGCAVFEGPSLTRWRWYYQVDNNWIKFGKFHNGFRTDISQEQLEECYYNDKRSIIEFSAEDLDGESRQVFELQMGEMKQHNLKTGQVYFVKRRPIYDDGTGVHVEDDEYSYNSTEEGGQEDAVENNIMYLPTDPGQQRDFLIPVYNREINHKKVVDKPIYAGEPVLYTSSADNHDFLSYVQSYSENEEQTVNAIIEEIILKIEEEESSKVKCNLSEEEEQDNDTQKLITEDKHDSKNDLNKIEDSCEVSEQKNSGEANSPTGKLEKNNFKKFSPEIRSESYIVRERTEEEICNEDLEAMRLYAEVERRGLLDNL